MHLALIPRARTTVLATLRILGMVLTVKLTLVFNMHESDEIYILFPTLKVIVNCLELTFIRNSHRGHLPQGGIILRYFVRKNELPIDSVLNDLTTLHEFLHDADMTLPVEIRNL